MTKEGVNVHLGDRIVDSNIINVKGFFETGNTSCESRMAKGISP